MNKIKSFFKLIRWTNLLMIAIMMLLVYYCLMSPLSSTGIIGAMPPSPSFALLLASMIFIVAAGYVINDLFDVEIDKLNKPDKLLITNVFSEKESKLFYVILTVLGMTCGLLSSIMILKSRFYTLFAILLLLVCLLYSYSANYKKRMFVGNLIVSVSVAFAVFLPWLFELLYLSADTLILTSVRDVIGSCSIFSFVMIYTAFAFLMTLIREIVKDAEDYKGDMLTHCRTIPIVLGIKKMNVILLMLGLLILALLLYYQSVLYAMHSHITLFIMLLISLCLFLLIIRLLSNKNINYHNCSSLLKILMLLGILSMLFV